MRVLFLSLMLALASCAQYGGSFGDQDGPGDAGPPDAPPPDAPPECDPTMECCGESGVLSECCPTPEECEECEECQECPEPPTTDPCECFTTCDTELELQQCLTKAVRDQGLCYKTPGQHFDVKFYCKIDGEWRSEKTWVYPCDEPYWWE